MDTNGSPLLGRSKNSHNVPPDSLHAQSTGPFSITRNFKADVHSGHPLRSPFSKLVSSNYNSQNPAKSISTQSYQYSENTSRSSLPLAARPLTIRTSGNEYTPSKGPILHQDIKTNQKAHSVQSPAPASLRQKLDAGDHLSYSKHSEESNDSEEHRDLNYTSTKLSQDLRQSFKEEYDVSPSPFRSMQSEIRGKTGTISAPENNSGYITGPPHRYGYSVDGLSNPSGRRSSTGLHICAGDNSIVDSRSRSSSVALSLKEQPADDLSALMFKGATDLRNAKLALEEQTKEMQKIKDELITVTAERNGLVQRVVLVKQKAKDGLELNAKKLSDMETLLQALESKSREYFAFVEVSRTSIADVENLKEILKNSAKCLETLVGEDGVYAPTQGWKAVLSEVQFDVSNKQQVIDMFRDRLEYTQGELADAKNRIAELEMLQSQDNNVLRLSSEKLVDAGSKLAELSALLKSQQQESVDTLIKNSELGAKLDVYEDDIAALKRILSEKDDELQDAASLRDELVKLRDLIKDRDEQMTILRGVKERFATTEELLKDREGKVGILEVSVKEKTETLETTQTRLSQAETQFANQLSLTQKLENDLGESRALLKSERDFRIIIMNEKEYLRSREEIMMSEISSLKKNLEEDRIKVRQSDTRFEMLQERFDDQAMMLRMEKKAHGDIQERLFAVETTYTKTTEDNKRTSELQTVQLKEQAKALESQLHDRQTELFNRAQEFASKLSDVELKFSQQMEEAEEKLIVKTDEMTRVQRDLENARTEVQSLQTKIQFLQQESNDLHKELIELKLPSKAHLQEISGLKSQLDGLRKTEELLSQRALTIVLRYEAGDLTAEEKRLIDTVHRTSQAGHEQELVAKGNEIRQRDNAIKALEKRKSELESQLARVLNMQATIKSGSGPIEGGRSLIDLEGWMSSQSSTSPPDRSSKAPDRDGPTTLIEAEAGPDTSVLTARTPVVKAQQTVVQPPLDNITHIAGVYQASTVHVSPPSVSSFAKLAAKSTDWSDDDIALSEVSAAKRKRELVASAVEDSEKTRPMRRTRTATRSTQQKASEGPAEDTLTKASAAAPKVKARKRR